MPSECVYLIKTELDNHEHSSNKSTCIQIINPFKHGIDKNTI